MTIYITVGDRIAAHTSHAELEAFATSTPDIFFNIIQKWQIQPDVWAFRFLKFNADDRARALRALQQLLDNENP
jgi:hypothetical protein